MPENIEIRLTVQGLLYGPQEDGYRMISGLDAEGARVVVGGRALPYELDEGDEIIVEGKWRHNDRGTMLMVDKSRKTLPQTERGMAAWLTKAKVPGVGKVRAERLVEAFGLDAIRKVIAKDDLAVKIVGKKVIEGAALALAEKSQEAEVGSMLAGYGIGGAVQSKILKKYGVNTQKVLLERPYALITEITGVAFTTADKIAKSTGIANDAPERIRAGIVETMRHALLNGHTAVYNEQLIKSVDRLLYVDYEKIKTEIEHLSGRQLVPVNIKGSKGWSTIKASTDEEQIATNVANKLKQTKPPYSEADAENAVKKAQKALGLTLNEKQQAAVSMALMNPLSILTGGPGTGKTLTLRILIAAWKLIVRQYSRQMKNTLLKIAAPTGRAAKRAEEVTGVEGKTIHRTLEYNPEDNGFERNRNNPIDSGFLAIDESSMPDIHITSHLSEAWGHSHVLLVGDDDQLPSVGPGRVLGDLISSGCVPTVQLTEIYRQGEGSAVAVGADEVKHGRMPIMSAPGKSDLVFIEINNPTDIAERIKDMYVNKMPSYLVKNNMDPTSIQILSPGKQSEVGTLNLNRIVQEAIHGKDPDGPVVALSDKMIGRIGDRVIQLQNDYELNVFNGDGGKIVEIETDDAGKVTTTHVDFGDRILSFSGTTLSNLTLSYALTIHKSQGSEFQVVIIPITPAHYNLNKRPLVYTGMTRAKVICVFVGHRKALKDALRREDAANRVTTLAQRVREKCGLPQD